MITCLIHTVTRRIHAPPTCATMAPLVGVRRNAVHPSMARMLPQLVRCRRLRSAVLWLLYGFRCGARLQLHPHCREPLWSHDRRQAALAEQWRPRYAEAHVPGNGRHVGRGCSSAKHGGAMGAKHGGAMSAKHGGAVRGAAPYTRY